MFNLLIKPFIILVLMFFKTKLGIISIFFQSVVFLFCIMIYLVSLREKKDELISSQENLKNIQNITHWKVVIWVLIGIKTESKGEHFK